MWHTCDIFQNRLLAYKLFNKEKIILRENDKINYKCLCMYSCNATRTNKI